MYSSSDRMRMQSLEECDFLTFVTLLQVITPYECEYTVMLSPPSAPVVKESTGITMFIIDEMKEAKEAKARLAKVNINANFNFQT